MFAKLHLLSQDVPEGSDGFRWRAHPYLRMAGMVPKGPVVFEWSARQRSDLEALWRDPASDGARERLARDLAVFCDRLGWAPDPRQLDDAEHRGEEYMLTVSAVPSELYLLPWEVVQVGAAGTYLSDFASAQVRYAMPGLGPRKVQTAPPAPGVLFAWSGAGGAVPHEEHAAAIRAAAGAGGATFRELAEVDEASLATALDDRPPSVLHLLCHGRPGAPGEPSRLACGASDHPSEITATRLARLLRPHEDAIRLVVLSACGSGDGHGDPLLMTSLAQELHKKGIPSVVASRYPLSVPGSCVMTRVLYDKLLRDAWSLERALRHTRQALLGAGDEAACPGDAYGIQLYTHDTEWFVSDNSVEAERPVLASYPFGTAARPVPAKGPASAELTVRILCDSELDGDELVDQLRHASEDAGLTVTTRSPATSGASSLVVQTTMDGGQRLIVTKGIHLALAGTLTTASTKVVGAAAGHLTAAIGSPPALGGIAARGGPGMDLSADAGLLAIGPGVPRGPVHLHAQAQAQLAWSRGPMHHGLSTLIHGNQEITSQTHGAPMVATMPSEPLLRGGAGRANDDPTTAARRCRREAGSAVPSAPC
ncbi:MAG: CHAT domain-containing protein [Deltaproteobacteria bacterium]|nr:MAG: CHAT domain-containing protein [Deltaproteobacteria bacterium]